MILKKNSPVFETTDGQKFLDLDAAKNNQIRVDVLKIYESKGVIWPTDLDPDDMIRALQHNREAFAFMFQQLSVTS